MAPSPLAAPYLVPAAPLHRVEEVVRRSRFIASVAPAPDPESAQVFIRMIRAEFPDATHHCWAFVAGPPGSTARIGLSDDGEPHGTAGRPILNVLLHSEVGEIVAVVTRYFGGAKLGTGGLSRAYAGVVVTALASLPTTRRVDRVRVRVEVPFAGADALFRALQRVGAMDTGTAEGDGFAVQAMIPRDRIPELEGSVAGFTSGVGKVEVLE